jgi:outer membrane protein assembly factor BamB
MKVCAGSTRKSLATPCRTQGRNLIGRRAGDPAAAGPYPLALLAIVFGLAGTVPPAQPALAADAPDSLLSRLGVSQGICVVVGDETGELALKLARQSDLLFYLQLAQAGNVDRVRRAADAAGFSGTRIYVEKGTPTRLYLADNLADAVLAVGDAISLSEAEALRVLRPQGKALLGQRELVKPFPAGADDWSHPYHGPDNNPFSHDQVARAPYLTQFLADPRYAPLPQLAVASAGRVFKAFGHIAFKAREEPWLNTLAAFNGYNGTLLWKRDIAPALMIHRNTLIATPTTVYFGDDKSCQVIDAVTGKLVDEIALPEDVAGGTFWKWMALEEGVLFALIGEQEQRDPVIRARREGHGWPWDPLSPGFNQPEHTWGFGRTLLAINPQSKSILWQHRETEPIDSRALCMKGGHLYAFRFGSYLSCIDAKTGQELWRRTRENAPELFKALGEYSKRQDWRTNWRTTAYLKCSDQALYFAGPTINKLLAVSAKDGSVLWEHPYDNYQLVLRDDALYGLSGQIDKDPTRKFDPLTGRILAEIPTGRRACTRVTGSQDALFCRANGGSMRLDVASAQPQLISPMRPNCHDGVTIANGLLYWWPSVCDCNLTLYGITCLAPAGPFDFSQPAVEAERLESFLNAGDDIEPLPVSEADWPTFRADNTCTGTAEAVLPTKAYPLWKFSPPTPFRPSAPTTAGDLVFLSGSDGIVRAVNAATGRLQWKAYTGGEVRYPPTLWQGRALVGSGDGWVYCFEAKTGRPLWRFRAAPVERRIPVYGTLQSTWPVGSGVLVQDGVAYAAAGIVNYDGTHVYALDAATGRIKWQNNSSGHLDPESHTGVSVQGHLMLSGGQLYLAGGNAVSPAVYDIRDGSCRNDPQMLRRTVNNNLLGSFSPRGSELYQIGNQIMVSGKPHYAHPQYKVYDDSVLNRTVLASSGDRAVAWINNTRLQGFARNTEGLAEKFAAAWGKPRGPGLQPLWQAECKEGVAMAMGQNALVIASASELTAYALADGRLLWTQPLPAPPVPWGLALNREGCVLVTLENGTVLCFSQSQLTAAR